ncbi:type IV toxin-antitoxin system AbiEi family antitoxin domain-containing protein [Terrabacter sp. 2YAF2]|uniref:type IV toxin-antitoxin system AbiEi family antitoxin domain-containing protein n=1 Tax=Terrabacter sp. 2YAF2 TaxID=3233026 RepID=UPI003F9E380B
MRADRVLEQLPRLRAQVGGQAGLLTRAQAHRAGISDEAIRWAVTSGRWAAPHPGVYLTLPGRDDWEVRAVAALLFVGTPVALAGPSAALAWGLERREPDAVHVVVPAGRRASTRAGIQVTRSRRFADRVDDWAWPHRTTVPHTVLDLGMRTPLDRVLGLATLACQRWLTDEARLAAALQERPDQTHRALLRECLADVGAGAESPAEVRFIRDVERAHGLPTALRQYHLGERRRCDNLYLAEQLVLEVDGRLGHEGWGARVRDGIRDRKSARHGLLTVRAFWSDVAVTPCDLAAELGELLRARGWTGSVVPCRRRDCTIVGRKAA